MRLNLIKNALRREIDNLEQRTRNLAGLHDTLREDGNPLPPDLQGALLKLEKAEAAREEAMLEVEHTAAWALPEAPHKRGK